MSEEQAAALLVLLGRVADALAEIAERQSDTLVAMQNLNDTLRTIRTAMR